MELSDNIDNVEYLESKIESEGFDYCFVHYGDFYDIEDKYFHKLREEFLKSRTALMDYLKEQGVKINE